jgi:hypothetical protein
LGELTPLGAEQHRGIAHRMYMRFPQVFNGNVHVDARSTIVIRCILSMENELMELARLNPRMVITSDASQHDMYYMNDEHGKYNKLRDTPEARQALADFNKNHENYSHLMGLLFNDTAYAHTVDANKLGQRLFDLAANIQSTELRHKFSLWPIFTDKEVYDSWQRKNAMWYMYYGPSRQAHSYGLLTQANLLNNIITTADSCLLLQHPGATLRFAHESDVMPLVCLLNLNHYGETIDDLEQLDDRGWNNYDIYPDGLQRAADLLQTQHRYGPQQGRHPRQGAPQRERGYPARFHRQGTLLSLERRARVSPPATGTAEIKTCFSFPGFVTTLRKFYNSLIFDNSVLQCGSSEVLSRSDNILSL